MEKPLLGYINHSGGAIGADTYWERIGNEYGVETRSYSFQGHKSTSPKPILLSQEQLNTADPHLSKANTCFKNYGWERRFPTKNLYVDNLLRRDWFQVLPSTQILAIGLFLHGTNIIDGGTGWAVQMAINEHKIVYVYHYRNRQWFIFNYEKSMFVTTDIPLLAQNFTGIGTRGEKNGSEYIFPQDAVNMIRNVYKNTIAYLNKKNS